MDLNLGGLQALVTGSSSGIGARGQDRCWQSTVVRCRLAGLARHLRAERGRGSATRAHWNYRQFRHARHDPDAGRRGLVVARLAAAGLGHGLGRDRASVHERVHSALHEQARATRGHRVHGRADRESVVRLHDRQQVPRGPRPGAVDRLNGVRRSRPRSASRARVLPFPVRHVRPRFRRAIAAGRPAAARDFPAR